MTCGIYCLEFEGVSTQKYIGQSLDIERRYTSHKRHLLLNIHHNYKLQNVYNFCKVYPKETLIEECSKDLLNTREIFWIEQYSSFINGYNLTKGGSLDALENGEHFNSKYPKEVYIQIFKELASTATPNKIIAEQMGVDKRVVDSISCGSNHTYLYKEYPELLTKMLNSRRPTRYIVSPSGEIYAIEYGKGNTFAKEHGLDGNSLNSVLRGGLKSTQKWTRYNG